jgi:hypothetical protein
MLARVSARVRVTRVRVRVTRVRVRVRGFLLLQQHPNIYRCHIRVDRRIYRTTRRGG